MLYQVAIGTGTAWTHSETVDAFTEQEAVDTVADKLMGSSFVSSHYELQAMCNPEETVDEYAEAHGLVCCGNCGVYLELINITQLTQ